MTMLIKSSAMDPAVRPFAAPPAPPSADAGDPSREEILSMRIHELEAELAANEADLPEKLVRAREAGAAEALEVRSDAEDRALDQLKEALDALLSHWSGRLTEWNKAAAGIASAVLEQVFTGPEDRSALVEAAILRTVERLRSDGLIRIRVSASDFGDPEILARAAAAVGPTARLECDPALQGGECIADLRLGHVDLGLGSQWRKVAELLDRLEREGFGR